jgi:ribosome-binding factor A
VTRPTLTDDEVQLAMNLVLREAQETGRRATITAVERRLDVKHATFYPEHHAERPKPQEDVIADLRRENTKLRRTLTMYAEALRQLTLDYQEVRSQVQDSAHVTDLAAHRSRRH